MKYGAYLLPEDIDVFTESLRCAEASGYERAWIIDGQMLYHDLYVYMARGLDATERIVVAPGVTNPFTRHYTVTASAMATLSQLHPGRVILGLGRGDNAIRTLGLDPVPTAQYAELVPRFRQLMAGEAVDAGGAEASIRWAAEDVPIMMAATGPRNLRLAGALADIVQIQVGVEEASVCWALELIHAGAEEAGRDPADVEISLICGMWVSDDLDEARRACRWAPPSAANHIEDVMAHNQSHGMPAELTTVVEERRAHAESFDYYKDHGDSTAVEMGFLTPELIDAFAIAGPPERCLAKIRELEALGVSEIASGFLNGELEQMQAVGRELVKREEY